MRSREQRGANVFDGQTQPAGLGERSVLGQGIQQSWQMKRERLSPCCTTWLADVQTARVWLK
ncbi:DUF4113 domain-containing protein [Cronobacter sakazakii]|uniref:DUF4113 domain-containing protein n=1 Tax=Cronobacter sakazakii TaxID=28141 RepID=UPI00289434A6|nr:DUF4113 domain-containing protein [Cronobacter sakazakii]MDT3638182.1 DUF4113 domain-containing protein [Cronobacter sakazakii]